MARGQLDTTAKQDGFYMPAEFAPQERVWLIWPERTDVWRSGAKPVQKTIAEIACAIAKFTPVTMCVSDGQYEHCCASLPDEISVVEVSSNDSWVRDNGPTFLINGKGELRACDWKFNAWGGLVNGAYFPWDKDDRVASKICSMLGIKSYRTEDFVLEGGSFHVDGEGTVLTTKMCLLDHGRNPHLSMAEIEEHLKQYLNVEKVLWLEDGIDPDETHGHVDDVACFARAGEAVCIYTEDTSHPFYEQSQAAYKALCGMTDAKGRALKVHKLCCTKNIVTLCDDYEIDTCKTAQDRHEGEICISSYLNFLITNGGVIVPQYGDENDSLALAQLAEIFPEHEIVGVQTTEIVYGGGNIHCMTQQQPRA